MRWRAILLRLYFVGVGLALLACFDDDARPYEEFVAQGTNNVVDMATSPDASSDMSPKEMGGAQVDMPSTEQCSKMSRQRITVTYVNKTGEDGVMYWITEACQALQYQSIPAGGSVSQSTFVGHVWSFRNARMEELSRFETLAGETMYEITKDVP